MAVLLLTLLTSRKLISEGETSWVNLGPVHTMQIYPAKLQKTYKYLSVLILSV